MPLLTIARDVQHTQSKGCWLCIHAGYTALYFGRPRLPKKLDRWQGIRIEIRAGARRRYRLALA